MLVEEITKPDLDIQIINVSPELAQRWLGCNTSNRKLKMNQVKAYSQEMLAGRWMLNGEAVKFSGSESNPIQLQDGQNRLHAIVKAGVTVPMLVVFNLPDNAQSTMDSGVKRSVADNLTIAGRHYASVMASAAALAIKIEDGNALVSNGSAPNSRVLEFIDANPSLERSASIAVQFATKADAPKSVVAYTHWRFSQIDLGEATLFWRDAAEKVGLSEGDPVLALCSRFSQARRQRERIAPASSIAATFRAWNARRQGETLRTVAFMATVGKLPVIK